VPLDFEDSSMAQAIGGANVQTALWAVRCRARSTPKGRGKTVKVVPQKEKGRQKNGGFGDKEQRKEPLWQCVKGCGACCKLAKDPSFATPEEIFENPSDIEVSVSSSLFLAPHYTVILYELCGLEYLNPSGTALLLFGDELIGCLPCPLFVF